MKIDRKINLDRQGGDLDRSPATTAHAVRAASLLRHIYPIQRRVTSRAILEAQSCLPWNRLTTKRPRILKREPCARRDGAVATKTAQPATATQSRRNRTRPSMRNAATCTLPSIRAERARNEVAHHVHHVQAAARLRQQSVNAGLVRHVPGLHADIQQDHACDQSTDMPAKQVDAPQRSRASAAAPAARCAWLRSDPRAGR